LAVAVGARLGLEPEELRRGLAAAERPKMRLQLWERNGVRVLDDAYNANADSMLAALQTLHDLPVEGRRIAVLGDMAELGEHTQTAHREVGRAPLESDTKSQCQQRRRLVWPRRDFRNRRLGGWFYDDPLLE